MTMKMTMAEFVGLEPCPFCGGEAKAYVKDYGDTHYWRVSCSSDRCGVNPVTNVYHTEARAVTAWNSRAERTCKCVAEYAKSPIDGKTIVLHRCSECHELMRPTMRYCPNCGAKVVGE